jgi:hypothetical protein
MRMFFVSGKQYLSCVVKTEVLYTVYIIVIFNATFSSLALNLRNTEQGSYWWNLKNVFVFRKSI